MHLSEIILERGSHATRMSGVCLMEAVAWYAGEQHDDCPRCVNPILIQLGQALNDEANWSSRQRLVGLIDGLSRSGHLSTTTVMSALVGYFESQQVVVDDNGHLFQNWLERLKHYQVVGEFCSVEFAEAAEELLHQLALQPDWEIKGLEELLGDLLPTSADSLDQLAASAPAVPLV